MIEQNEQSLLSKTQNKNQSRTRSFLFDVNDDHTFAQNRINLYWENVNCVVKRTSKKQESRQILFNLKGSIESGRITAILGSSGSGKTTLINILSGRNVGTNLHSSGLVKFNNVQVKSISKYRQLIGFVSQEDNLLPTLSIRQTLQFAADMRLNEPFTSRQQKVESLINDLNLLQCADTKIGSSLIRGASGGERKRTSIGVELIINPMLIFLDEPTTGLDSDTALQVMDTLQKLAKQRGKTVISILHQPNHHIFNKFDDLILICQGHILYHGDTQQILPYFRNLGFECPVNYNPADYLMKIVNLEDIQVGLIQAQRNISIKDSDVLAKAQLKQRISQLLQNYLSSELYMKIGKAKGINNDDENFLQQQFNKNKKNEVLKLKMKVPIMRRLLLITKRSMISQFATPSAFGVRVIQYLVFSLVFFMTFSNLGSGMAGVQNRDGACWFICVLLGWTGFMDAVSSFSEIYQTYQKERLNKYYSIPTFALGHYLGDLPYHIFYPSLFMCIVYFSVGLNFITCYKFFVALAMANMIFLTAAAYGFFFACFVPGILKSITASPVVLVPLQIFAGYFVNQHSIPYYFYPFTYISFFKYGFQALCINEYMDLSPPLICEGQPCEALQQHDFPESLALSFFLQSILFVLFKCLACIVLFCKSQSKDRGIRQVEQEEDNPNISQNNNNNKIAIINQQPLQDNNN